MPIARRHQTIGSMFVTQNAYPREALLEAHLRFVERISRRRHDGAAGALPHHL